MDGKHFDHLTKQLVSTASRHQLVLGVAATLAGGIAFARSCVALAGPKVTICHRTSSGRSPVEIIHVDTTAVPAAAGRSPR